MRMLVVLKNIWIEVSKIFLSGTGTSQLLMSDLPWAREIMTSIPAPRGKHLNLQELVSVSGEKERGSPSLFLGPRSTRVRRLTLTLDLISTTAHAFEQTEIETSKNTPTKHHQAPSHPRNRNQARSACSGKKTGKRKIRVRRGRGRE